MENKPNTHGYLYLKCLIDEKVNFNATIKASTEDEISVYEETENTEDKNPININTVDESKSKILFNGIVQNIRTSNESGIYYVEIQALTSSFKLDIKKKSRSFQNINATYEDIINTILTEYSACGFTQNQGKGQKIGKPLFQYKETDWDFIKRLASEIKLELYCDIINKNNMFNFGIPSNNSYELKDNTHYEVFKDIKKFYEVSGTNGGYNDTDYFYYQVKIRDILEIGSKVSYKNKELYIREYEAYKHREEIYYKYKLCIKSGVWQNKIYNESIKGATIEGKVIGVEGEKVKLHLNIDENQSESEAYWFSYAPPSVNIMYSMPLMGESVRLYFPNEFLEEPIATGCVRKNGETCLKTSNPEEKYFETEHGSEIAMLKDSISIKGGSEAPLNITFDDETGVTFTSPNDLNLNAGGNIIISTKRNININAQSQISMTKGNTENGVSIEGEFHIKGNNVIKNGNSRESYAPFKDGVM